MKRYLFVLIMAIVCYGVTVAQPALIASEDDQEIMSIIFNPEWDKAHNIKEIATTVFYAQKTDPKNYITTTKIFDSSGYQTIEFEGRGVTRPTEQTFIKKKNIQHFKYEHALIKKEEMFQREYVTDTAQSFGPRNTLAANPEHLDQLIVGPDTFTYKFNEMRRPVVIAETGGRKVRTINYNDKGQVSKIEVKHSNT